MDCAFTNSRATLHERKMLLVGRHDPEEDLRATFLREYGVQVDVASSIAEAQGLWRPKAYLWVLVDVRKHLPGEVVDFCEEIRKEWSEQKIAYLVGPPEYIAFTWPEEGAVKPEESRQWDETVAALSKAA